MALSPHGFACLRSRPAEARGAPRPRRPSKRRPQRNEPALLPYVLEAVAAARGQTPEHVAHITTANAKRLFGL